MFQLYANFIRKLHHHLTRLYLTLMVLYKSDMLWKLGQSRGGDPIIWTRPKPKSGTNFSLSTKGALHAHLIGWVAAETYSAEFFAIHLSKP